MKILSIIIILFISASNSHSQWVQFDNGMAGGYVTSLAHTENNIFAGVFTYDVYLSSNYGSNWIWRPMGSGHYSVNALAATGTNIFAGTDSDLYLSTDDGAVFYETSLNIGVNALAIYGNYIYAGTRVNKGVYLSTDNGSNWVQTSLHNRTIRSLAANGNNVYAGTTALSPYYGLFLSTNNGTTWNQTSLNFLNVYSITVSGNNIYAGTHNYPPDTPLGVYLSTDNGTTWTQTSLNNYHIWSLAFYGNTVFAGTNNGVYISSDNGSSWITRNEGLPSGAGIHSLCIYNNYIFAGTSYYVFRRPLSELTGILQISTEISNRFSLLQNYPNPFNPGTKIQFTLPKASFTKIIMYDMLGKEIEIIASGQLNAGTYEAYFDGSKLSSGVYYYRLIAEDYSETKKMVLMK